MGTETHPSIVEFVVGGIIHQLEQARRTGGLDEACQGVVAGANSNSISPQFGRQVRISWYPILLCGLF